MCDLQWYIRFADISPLKIDEYQKGKGGDSMLGLGIVGTIIVIVIIVVLLR